MPTVVQRIETLPIGYANYVKPSAEKPLLNDKENSIEHLINELKVGEESGMLADFDRQEALSNLHAKYLHHEV